uniref:HAT C-terminal dimerisation domain-containing protein n=1 Tax=Paramormyrops kingsleyae TaxID=1676925 RepID=A0A3B3QQ95_9TELE
LCAIGSGVGFLELAQGLINIGARAGKVDAQQILPNPTTVSHRLKKYAEDTRQSITPELRSQLTDSSLCVTLHYINRDWELKERVLCIAEWDSTLCKPADNIRPPVIYSLRKFGLEDFFSKLVYVTDKGSNIVVALRTVTRLNCTAHILNTVLHTILGKNTEEDLFGEEVFGLIESAKSLVTYFKQSHLHSRLDKTLIASVETRWNSLHTLLDSMSSQYEAIRVLLEERGEEDRLTSISMETLNDIVAFLLLSDQAEIMRVHSEAQRLVKGKIYSGTSGGPRGIPLKSLLLPGGRKIHEKHEGSQQPGHNTDAVNPAAKRPRQAPSDLLSDVEDSSDDTELTEGEVSAYIELKPPKGDSFDVLLWWKQHEKTFPDLAMVARDVLSIPALSAASERDFSSAGFVIEERRTQLKPGTVDDILFLHSNLD